MPKAGVSDRTFQHVPDLQQPPRQSRRYRNSEWSGCFSWRQRPGADTREVRRTDGSASNPIRCGDRTALKRNRVKAVRCSKDRTANRRAAISGMSKLPNISTRSGPKTCVHSAPNTTVSSPRHAPQHPVSAKPSERSAAAELSRISNARTRPRPFNLRPRRRAQRSARGNTLSGVATSAPHRNAIPPLMSHHASIPIDAPKILEDRSPRQYPIRRRNVRTACQRKPATRLAGYPDNEQRTRDPPNQFAGS
jgi:hypothetical protein